MEETSRASTDRSPERHRGNILPENRPIANATPIPSIALGVSVCHSCGEPMDDVRVSSAVDAPGGGRLPTVSVVTVNYNGRRYLERFLESLFAIEYPSQCYQVVFVDNAS